MDITKEGIIVISKNNEYLLYYNIAWDSFRFPCFDLNNYVGSNYFDHISGYLSDIFNIDFKDIKYKGHIIHKQYNVAKDKDINYEHYFYLVNLDDYDFEINSARFAWYEKDDILNNKRIQLIDYDIMNYVLNNFNKEDNNV